MRRLCLLAGVALVALGLPAAGPARAASGEGVREYRTALMRIVRRQETYGYKDMGRDLRRAYEVFIKPWLDRGLPNAPTEIEYDFKAYRAVFEKWIAYDEEKAEAALQLAKTGDLAATKLLFSRLTDALNEIEKQGQALQKLRPKAYSVYEQEPAIRRYGARIHADGLIDALGAIRDDASVAWLAEDAWKLAGKRDKRRRSDLARVSVLDALGGTKAAGARDRLAATASGGSRRLRLAALENLVRLSGDRVALRERLVGAVADDPCFAVRAAALGALAKHVPDPRAVPVLARALKKEIEGPNGLLRALLHRALREIVGEDLGMVPESWLGWYRKNREAIESGAWKKGGGSESDAGKPPGRESVTFYDIRTLSKRILTLVDASDTLIMPVDIEKAKRFNYFYWRSLGSKDRNYVSQYDLLVQETEGMLKAMKADASFNLVVMHGSCQLTLFSPKGMAPASEKSKRRAVPFLKDMVIEGWAPQIWSLWAAYDMAGHATWSTGMPDQPAADTIFLLSDGVPAGGHIMYGPALVDDVRRRHRFTRIPVHTIRIGDYKLPAEEVMEGIAEVTGGTYVWRKKP